MKYFLLMVAVAMMATESVQAQDQPAGMRVEVAEDENGLQLGEPVTTTCAVVKKTLGGKRLQFLFPEGKRQGRAYLSKSTLKNLRMNFKIDIKLHPKQHRKQ